MTITYQQSAVRRKITYFAIIIALFIVTTFVRGLVAMPLSGKIDEQFRYWNIAGQAERLEMTENTQGETELTGSAVRLLLTGSRGLMICALWDTAIDKQKKHEWNELELLVRSITKLQPHFITPWMFQSWNLTYNVSVEMDNLGDMYFYIARGISLLAEGESINRYNPEMRYYLAFYYQNKFGVSDKVTTLRCLMQLSCIAPSDREISELQRGNQIQVRNFEKFCTDNPRLIRKLREFPIKIGQKDGQDVIQYLADRPAKVIEFIAKHKTILDVVTRYRDGKELHEQYLKQFPVLPPKFVGGQDELTPALPMKDGNADAYLVGRAWYTYANEAVPPPSDEPGPTPTDYVDPEHKRRVPRSPMLIIFMQGPPRAQSYVAEGLAKEGWFDEEPWIMDRGVDAPAQWFPNAAEPIRLYPSATSKLAWRTAKDMWEKDGKDNGLIFSDDRQRLYTERAKKYAAARGASVDAKPEDLRPSELNNQEMVDGFKAQQALFYRRSNLQVTQFDNFYYSALVEEKDEMIAARKKFFQAERYRLKQMLTPSIEAYQSAFADWKKILYGQQRFRDFEMVQRDSYETELRYMLQYRVKNFIPLLEKTRNIIAVMAPVVLLPSPSAPDVPAFAVAQPFWFDDGPLDGVDKDGKPWIRDDVKTMVKSTFNPSNPSGPPPPPRRPAAKSGAPEAEATIP